MNRAFSLSAGMMLCVPSTVSAKATPSLDGEKILADFARCAVREAPQQARRVLGTTPESVEEQSQIDFLLQKHGKCMNLGSSLQSVALAASVNLGNTPVALAASQLADDRRQMNFSRRSLRGALAIRLYREGSKVVLSDQSRPDSNNADPMVPAGYAVVLCAAERDPLTADRLVRSKRMSDAEAEAGRAFAPALNACARGRGKVDISGTAIHGWAAEALYKQRRPVATAESN